MTIHEWPQADYGGAWAELQGYVRQAKEDGTQIDPAALEAYLAELKAAALTPVREVMAKVVRGDSIRLPRIDEGRMPTLSQLAYEMYCEQVDHTSVRGEQLPAWDYVPDRIRRAWQAAVSAVVEALL